MKKLIAISVVFALVAGVAFAVDIGGTVIGTVKVIEADSDKDLAGDPTLVRAGGAFDRIRFEGGGEVADGKFGGWLRLDGIHWSGKPYFDGNAWWKPIPQLKVLIGGSGGDGFWGKDGVTGWMWNQQATDNGVSMGGNNSWGGSYYGIGIQTRDAFSGGFGGDGLVLEIKPLDILGINLAIPFFDKNGLAEDVFSHIFAMVDLNFSFGNIALIFEGGKGYQERVAPKPVYDPTKMKGEDKAAVGGWDWGIYDVAGNFTATQVTVDGKLVNGPTSLKPYDPTAASGTLGATDKVGFKWNPNKTPAESATSDPGWVAVGGKVESDEASKFRLYFSLTAIENLGIDFGIGYSLPTKATFPEQGYDFVTSKAKDYTETTNNPLAIGLGVKYAMGAFAVKFRTVLSFGGSTVADGYKPYEDYVNHTDYDTFLATLTGTAADNHDKAYTNTVDGRFRMLLDILPYFALNDSARIYLSAGIGLQAASKYEEAVMDYHSKYEYIPDSSTIGYKKGDGKDYVKTQLGWHVNPYVEIGEEWGPKFFAGIKVWSNGLGLGAENKPEDAIVNFAIPLALQVSF